MNIQKIIDDAHKFFGGASFIHKINTPKEHDKALELMDVLIEDYEGNEPLINVLWPTIEAWEKTADEFVEFNKQINEMDSGVSVLKVIMDQHQLTTSDFKDEIGGKSLVSLITNNKRQLTIPHIKALSKRFNVEPSVFI